MAMKYQRKKKYSKVINGETPRYCSKESEHYTSIIAMPTKKPSKAVQDRMHRYVNIAKEMYNNGITSNGRTFHCSFFVRKSKVICISWNDYDRQIDYLPNIGRVRVYGEPSYKMSLHSELSGILKLGYSTLYGITCYNVRIDKNGHCKVSKPCNNCYRLLKQMNVDGIVYYDEDMTMKMMV